MKTYVKKHKETKQSLNTYFCINFFKEKEARVPNINYSRVSKRSNLFGKFVTSLVYKFNNFRENIK